VYEHSTNDFATLDSHTLANAPSSVPTPASVMATYIGDYVKLQAVGTNFYGVFCANNTPDMANFPSGISYQRIANWSTNTLLGTDGVTPVAVSIDPFFFVSTGVDPSEDFYVRDWTASPVSFDTGVEPSTNPVFYTTSDVWNQRSNAAPTFNANDQPNSEDPQIAAMGSNYAFARISRRAPAGPGAASVAVTAEFLFADFGLGVPYADISASPTVVTTFAATDNQLVTDSVSWTLPATHSQHVCVAVQVSAPNDPYQQPSLVGMSPGWGPAGSDTTVLNDNHKAQRNLGIYPAGQVAGRWLGNLGFYAVLHNAATFTREMNVAYAGGTVGDEPTRSVTVSLFGGTPVTLKPGEVLSVPAMQPGVNRWLRIEVGDSGGAVRHDFQEVFAGKRLSGFRVQAQPSTTAALVRWNAAAEHALHDRVQALFARDPPRGIAAAVDKLLRAPDDGEEYCAFLEGFVMKTKHFEIIAAEIELGPVDPNAVLRRLAATVRRKDAAAASVAHADMLHTLDALLTMVQKARGDAGDILLNLQWQRALYARAPVGPALVDTVRQRSTEFIRAFQARRATAKDFPDFIHGLAPDLERTVEALGARGRSLQPLVRRLRRPARGKAADPATVQKNHRAYLTELQAMLG
jgi:hypothetical protein